MKYILKISNTFKKDVKLLNKRGYNISLLTNIIKKLSDDIELESIYDDHKLKGNFKDFRCCHITSDWLLIYKKNDKELILYLTRTGTHSDIY